MRKKWIKWTGIVVLTPIVLFVLLMALLYVPPVQNLLRREATAYASEATGMDIRVERLDLRFPLTLLVRGVQVIRQPDTLLTLESLRVKVQALPLLKGKVVVDYVTLKQGSVNTADLIKTMRLKGEIGRFHLNSRSIDLSDETAFVNLVELTDARVRLALNDTVQTPGDSASTPVNWRIDVRRLQLKNVDFFMEQSSDSMRISTVLPALEAEGATIDLRDGMYALNLLRLTDGKAGYRTGDAPPDEGFDASHIVVRDVNIGLDSLYYRQRQVNAVIRELRLNERSGLSIASLTGHLQANDTVVRIPYFDLQTPHSAVSLRAHASWPMPEPSLKSRLTTRLDAYIGKEDVMRFIGALPKEFQEAYPFRPITLHLGTEGNLNELKINPFTLALPGAFMLKGDGTLRFLTDSLSRSGEVNIDLSTGNLDFLTALAGPPDGSITIPDSLSLTGKLSVQGNRYAADVRLRDGGGYVHLSGHALSGSETYTARLKAANIDLHRFLPKDSLYELSFSGEAEGRGWDFASPRAFMRGRLALDSLHYGRYRVAHVQMTGSLKNRLLTAQLTSDNELLRMTADAEYAMGRNYWDGRLKADIRQLNVYDLRLVSRPFKEDLSLRLEAEARQSTVRIWAETGDLSLDVNIGENAQELIRRSDRLAHILKEQIERKRLDHAELRRELPYATVAFTAGKENPLAYYLADKDIAFADASLHLVAGPQSGMNGRAFMHTLKVDTFQLDTLYLVVKQDTSRLHFHTGVVNGPRNPRIAFSASVRGEVRNEDAELLAEFKNGAGERGLLLGLNARPLTLSNGKGDGLIFHLIPENPVVAFREFHFNDEHNWLYLHNNMRAYANIDMVDKEGMAVRLQSVSEDTLSLQNMNVELRRLRLDDISRLLPYYPEFGGMLTAEAHFKQTEKELQLSTEVFMDELIYERQRVGDVTVGATWLPGEKGRQYMNGYLAYEQEEVFIADGKLMPTPIGKDSLEVSASFTRFPLKVANAFIPDGIVALAGHLNGEVNITGSTESPSVGGELMLDSTSAYSRAYAVNFKLDNRPIQVTDNRMTFDRFAIYTTSKNPFTVDGYVDFRDMSRPMVNLNMLATDFTLLDAKRTRESVVYGKVLTDFRAMLRGPLDGLVLRGNMNLLGSTDVSYILADSPLTVQDRLGSLVTFTSFSDTLETAAQETPAVSLGGLDMNMMVHIDQSVRVKVDLDLNTGDRVELEGGGDLTMKYTPQGDLSLTGRYTMTGGMMKYALPVIAAKEFEITNGSYIEWTGDPMNPRLNFRASDNIRASVADDDDGGTRSVNFQVAVVAKNRLSDIEFSFDVSAPEDAAIQNELTAMGAEERGKQALYIMVAKTYMGNSAASGGSALNMGTALNSVLSSQINSLMGNLRNASFSLGVDEYDDTDAGGKRTDYSFRYSQRFFNNRIRIVIGGKVSTGANVTNDAESFIDNVSLEYRLDSEGTRYVRLFYDKNYESVLEGEITEAGVGLVLRKRLDKLSELFIFRRRKKQ